ncbi:MAG: class I SAM-dependent methyltransferase, partial [Bacteroidota bacterium]|nr:class I SAM-dependent methyltransferase [Bacteroidota bacterium]
AHPKFYLDKETETSRYGHHHNGIDQPGYITFLNRAIEPTLPLLNTAMKGLDYGCGPSPTLSKILLQKGFTCFDFDPLFRFEHPLKSYDFIFATECIEHFFNPSADIRKIVSLLKPNGTLTIMTERWETLDQFKTWYYKNDPTHVSFFHTITFAYISNILGLEKLYQDNNRVIIFKKI